MSDKFKTNNATGNDWSFINLAFKAPSSFRIKSRKIILFDSTIKISITKIKVFILSCSNDSLFCHEHHGTNACLKLQTMNTAITLPVPEFYCSVICATNYNLFSILNDFGDMRNMLVRKVSNQISSSDVPHFYHFV